MEKLDIRTIINEELDGIRLSDQRKNNIIRTVTSRKPNQILKGMVASIVIIMAGITVVYAGTYVYNRISVNETILPELEPMEIVQVNEFEDQINEYGYVDKYYNDYDTIKKDLGIPLLDNELSENNPYMLASVRTDTKDYVKITIENFIIGDTCDYKYIQENNEYIYDSGKEYLSSVSLTADLIISESQLETGWDRDYLGLYQYVESYISVQGYKVNILEDTIEDEESIDYVSNKIAIFVADGIRYTLKGKISIDTLRSIVDSMEYKIE